VKQIIKEITKYRTLCLIHRYLYYVKSESLISDFQYDTIERKLRALVAQHPALAGKADYALGCPVSNVGSSNADDYPRRIEQLAESLLAYHKKGKQ
jgi:NAD-dependent DNA ligase